MNKDAAAPRLDLAPLGGRRRVLCRMCGTELHDPISRAAGLGPDCYARLYGTAPRPDGHHVDQDAIPGT